MDKIAVLIPCYNEEQTIEKVVKDFKNYLPEATIYVYDNNSNNVLDYAYNTNNKKIINMITQYYENNNF